MWRTGGHGGCGGLEDMVDVEAKRTWWIWRTGGYGGYGGHEGHGDIEDMRGYAGI